MCKLWPRIKTPFFQAKECPHGAQKKGQRGECKQMQAHTIFSLGFASCLGDTPPYFEFAKALIEVAGVLRLAIVIATRNPRNIEGDFGDSEKTMAVDLHMDFSKKSRKLRSSLRRKSRRLPEGGAGFPAAVFLAGKCPG